MIYKNQYLIKKVTAGETLEIYKTQSSRYGYNIPREENKGKTPEAVEKNNQRMAENTLRQLINTNFTNDDYHLILKYYKGKRPETLQEVQKHATEWVRRARRELARKEETLKYIYAVEIGGKGGVHIHIIANRVDLRILRRCWEPNGTIWISPLYSDGQYKDLANYIIKQTSKMLKQRGWSGRRYTPSKNLKKPDIEKAVVKAKEWRKQPLPPKGYMFDPAFPLVNGVCEESGIAYQRCGFIKIRAYKERYSVWNYPKEELTR